MPRKHSIKSYVSGGYYHLYNRGVEKRKIFLNDHDYLTFLNLLKQYLSPPSPDQLPKIQQRSLYGQIELIAYCLMPNHYHLLVRQTNQKGITDLIKKIITNYVTFFNQKYDRVGGLFQGIYKGILVENDSHLLHLSRYLHLNPQEIKGADWKTYPYSSYRYFLNSPPDWLNPQPILDFFQANKPIFLSNNNSGNSYSAFVEEYHQNPHEILGDLVLEAL